MIVRAGGAIWLNHFAMVLFNVSSTVTVPVLHGLFSSVLAINERRNIDLYEVLLSMSLLCFGMGTILVYFICVVLCCC